jgi:hypothetical protein
MVFDRKKIEKENERLKKEVHRKEPKESSIIKGKLLSKPKVSLRKVDVLNHLKNMTHEEHELYESPRVELNEDKRSLFFKDEFIKEKNINGEITKRVGMYKIIKK